MPVVLKSPKLGYKLPSTADDCRDEIEDLRGQLSRGEIRHDQFAHASARLTHHIGVLERKKQRLALT